MKIASPLLERIDSLSLEEVTDWYIPDDQEVQLLVYPGAIVASGELAAHAKNLRDAIHWRLSQTSEALKDWRLEYEGLTYRAHRQNTVDGVMYILRRISANIRAVEDLGLPDEVVSILLDSDFAPVGGLVLVSGGPGQGKSTTVASIVKRRVMEFGHFLLTVEDPPEFSLQKDYLARNGRFGKIVQVPANRDTFADDLRDALRCYPANMRGSMLMVGEVRDGATAGQVLRAAVNGQLVFATLHAADPLSALERILALAKEDMGAAEAQSILGMSLRAILKQQILGKALSLESIFSLTSVSSVASRIKQGSIAQLSTDIQQQKTHLAKGTLREYLNKR